METTTSRILESKFFSPAFNTAIFDGPVRLYFSQTQESEALKVYFKLQDHFENNNDPLDDQLDGQVDEKSKEVIEAGKRIFRDRLPDESTLFIMLYPNKELFLQSFDDDNDIIVEKFGSDIVIGVQAPLSDNLHQGVVDKVEFIMNGLDL